MPGGLRDGLDPGAAAGPGRGSCFWNRPGPFWKQETPRSEGWRVLPGGGSPLLPLGPPSRVSQGPGPEQRLHCTASQALGSIRSVTSSSFHGWGLHLVAEAPTAVPQPRPSEHAPHQARHLPILHHPGLSRVPTSPQAHRQGCSLPPLAHGRHPARPVAFCEGTSSHRPGRAHGHAAPAGPVVSAELHRALRKHELSLEGRSPLPFLMFFTLAHFSLVFIFTILSKDGGT